MAPDQLESYEYATIAGRYIGGESYAAIGRDYGVSRERIRQIVKEVQPDAKARRRALEALNENVKAQRQAEAEAQRFIDRLQEVIDQDLRCATCGGWVIRDTGRDDENKTCSSECAKAWVVLKSFPEVAGDVHRNHMATSILGNKEKYSDAEIEWAQRMQEDAPPPNRRWVQEGSRRAEVLKKYRPEIYEELVR